jgi:Rho guanine nucleotide exchange factor 12
VSLSIGNCLILDGYEAVQESSTDEEVASSFTLQPGTGIPSVDSTHQQQHSPQNAHFDGAVSPFTPEFLVQRRWGTMEDSCFEIQSPSSCTDSQSQIMEYIHKIEADLEHLKVPHTSPP